MLSTQEATAAILAAMPAADTESVPLENATGKVLRQSVTAERDQPPFDRVTMDGIAFAYAAIQDDNRELHIQSRQHAGEPAHELRAERNCIEIMTGSMLPGGCDCIVPVERIAIGDGVATLEDGYHPEQHQFIHPRGSDYQQGQELLTAGHRIRPTDIAVIASSGLAAVDVATNPTICVVSTGDELVAAGEQISDHQIRLSNGPAVEALLRSHGYTATEHHHLQDDKAQLAARLDELLSQCNVLVLSGGVSMGKADFVPEVLLSLGVEVVFHKIRQRPGLPMWFGIGPAGQAVFALPGNPVSTLVCCRQYVIPALASAASANAVTAHTAVLAEAYSFKPDLTCFLPVRLCSGDDGQLLATPAPTNTSGDFRALSSTDGYVELDRELQQFPAGSVLRVRRW